MLMERKKLVLACVAITIAALAVVATVVFAFNRSANQPPASPKQVTLSGNLTCLPHKNVQPGQPVTLECAIGLRTNDKRFYGLQQLPEDASVTDFNQSIEVSGELSLPTENERYDIAGTIKVNSFKTK
jgi:hypothetical protein